jgi:hypothetical protein
MVPLGAWFATATASAVQIEKWAAEIDWLEAIRSDPVAQKFPEESPQVSLTIGPRAAV